MSLPGSEVGLAPRTPRLRRLALHYRLRLAATGATLVLAEALTGATDGDGPGPSALAVAFVVPNEDLL